MHSMTPREIVAALDQHIVGQAEAKRKVAIALRNRWRRQQLPDALREEVAPKNIIMIGPTGVGKTEIARRLAKLADAPFIKVEASKFTEVGYVGRDCESMIRDLIEVGVKLIREEMRAEVAGRARENAERRLLDLLVPPQPARPQRVYRPSDPSSGDEGPARDPEADQAEHRTREIVQEKLRSGALDDKEVDISVKDNPPASMMQVFSNSGLEEMGVNFQEVLGKMMPQKRKQRRLTVAEARAILEEEEVQELIDMDVVNRRAVERVENMGIVFLDEIDKIAGRNSGGHGPDVSREGVQRDILPIVEGSTVITKYGPVRTDHVLFIAAGAFHMTKVSDLIPELQGRFPIRVELQSLNAADFVRILREPTSSLLKQYQALLEAEEVALTFTDEAVEAIAAFCERVNRETEDIGARRLHTILECLLEPVSFDASEQRGTATVIDLDTVNDRLAKLVEHHDLSKYVL